MKEHLSMIVHKASPILKRAGITRAFIFGSYATGQVHKNSDIDFLVRAPSAFGLLELVALRDELRRTMGKEVDLVSDKAVHPSLKRIISTQAVRIL